MKKFCYCVLSLLILQGLCIPGNAQSAGDTLMLDEAVNLVISGHPTILAASKAVEEAEGRIDIAKSARLPGVDASASYSRIGPVPSFDFPDYGTITLFPEDNYSMSVNVRQLISDFGRTAKSIEMAEASKSLSTESLELVRQNLSMAVINTYYQLLLVQESIQISDDELKNLNEHLGFITMKQETGSATQYEILSTKVKISVIENQKLDMIANREILSAVMNALLGRPSSPVVTVSGDLKESQDGMNCDSMINMALQNREELKISEEQERMAMIRYEMTKAINNPTLSAFASGGGKNGYVPDLYAFRPNFTTGLSVFIPIFDGYREKSSLRVAQAEIESSQFRSENVRRELSTDVIRARSNLLSSFRKVDQINLQVKQASQAFNLAQTNYKAGAITNLDLLDAEISLATSRMMLTKARIDYVLNVWRLKLAVGEKLYHMVG